MDFGLRIKLSVMMFLQYAVLGTWFVPLASYLLASPEEGGLAFTGTQVGHLYSTPAIAAIVSPFFIGIVADRYFSTERCLGVLHLAGAVFLYLATRAEAGQFGLMFSLVLLHTLCYLPTMALTNSISFRNMDKPEKQFPSVRVFGTIGWMVVGLVVGLQTFGLNEVSAGPLYVASGLSALLGCFCFILPHTPPTRERGESLAFVRALSMMKDRSFSIFIAVALLISIVLAFYYQLANPFLHHLDDLDTSIELRPQALMTVGQFTEMLLLPFLPWFILKLGIRWTLALGMAAWCLRYLIFSGGSLWPVILIGLPLHGICYDFFFVMSQIYVDEKAPPDLRASAQGFLACVTLGLGMYLGNLLAGYTNDWATVEGVTNWATLWLVPFSGALVSLALFLLFFREPGKRH